MIFASLETTRTTRRLLYVELRLFQSLNRKSDVHCRRTNKSAQRASNYLQKSLLYSHVYSPINLSHLSKTLFQVIAAWRRCLFVIRWCQWIRRNHWDSRCICGFICFSWQWQEFRSMTYVVQVGHLISDTTTVDSLVLFIRRGKLMLQHRTIKR
jgi:hypothetical protein